MRRPINTVNGYYKDPGKHWSAQDALNVLVRMAEKSGTRTVSRLVDAPGLRPFCRIGTNGGEEVGFTPSGAGRGMRVVDGRLFVVAGRTLWQITADGVSVPYGTIPGVGRVSMAHTQRGNGFELSIDNTQSRYVFNTLTQSLQKVTDESFPGSMRAFAIDGYTGYLEPQGLYWGHSDLANALNYIAFDTYEAEGQPDRIVSATVDNNRQVLIIGQQTTEIYVNQGSAQAPFVRASNTIIPYGSAARDSVQNFGSGTVLLDQNRVVRILSTGDDRISTSVIDSALQECTRQQIANAYSFALEGDGFQIYYLTVPGKFTFGFDFVNREWHRRSSTDLDWWAVTDVVQWNGKWYALDSRVGEIFEVRWRDYPFDGQKELVREWVTGSVSADQNPVYVHELELLFGCGGQAYAAVDFPDQPTGPSISGEAPDAVPGEAYSFPYTTTPGDAPIARTSLREGSYVVVDGVQKTLAEAGWAWNQSTATVSSAAPVVSSVVLKLRTFDENGLYADHEDAFEILEAHEVLISGQNESLSTPYMCSFLTTDISDITGIPQASGATQEDAVGAYGDGGWCVVANGTALFAPTLADNWTSATAPATQFAQAFPDSASGFIAAVSPGSEIYGSTGGANFSLITRTAVTPAHQANLTNAYRTFRLFNPNTEAYEWWSLNDQYMFTCDDPLTDSWETRYRWLNTSMAARLVSDVAWHEGLLYACGVVESSTYGVCFSSDNGATWSLDDIIFTAIPNTSQPVRLFSVGGDLVAYCNTGTLRSMSSGWEIIPLGITGVTSGGDIPLLAEVRSRAVVIGELLYVLGTGDDGNKIVTFNPATQEVSAPTILPNTSAVGIAARKL
jgi:hypothetical protein